MEKMRRTVGWRAIPPYLKWGIGLGGNDITYEIIGMNVMSYMLKITKMGRRKFSGLGNSRVNPPN